MNMSINYYLIDKGIFFNKKNKTMDKAEIVYLLNSRSNKFLTNKELYNIL